MKAYKLITIAAVFGLAAFSPAPIKDLRRNVQIQPEKSQEMVEQDQRNHQMVQPPMAQAPDDTEVPHMSQDDTPDAGAAKAIRANDTQREAEVTKQNIKEGKEGLSRKQPADMTWLWGIFVALLGFGIVFAVKQVAGRSIPDMPESLTNPKKRSGW